MEGTQTPDFESVTKAQQQVWSQGDFSVVAAIIQIVAEDLCEAVDLVPGKAVLDVACGSGNVAIAAARRFCGVTGVDYVPSLLERGRERARVEGFEIDFVEGDAQALPFEDGSFDYVLSTFGAMFAPDQERTAAELLRVCRPGGRIGMANWTPQGFVGKMFRTVAGAMGGPPPDVKPPPLWGTEERLHELFGDQVSELRAQRRNVQQRFPSPQHWLAFFREYFGPTRVAFASLDDEAGARLESDLLAVVDEHNRSDEAMIVPAEYLEVVAIRAS